jgi:DNA-binding MarR family transcriptional regulator
MVRPTSAEVTRDIATRRTLVLRAIREHGPITFAQLLEVTGLGRGALTHAVNDLSRAFDITWAGDRGQKLWRAV